MNPYGIFLNDDNNINVPTQRINIYDNNQNNKLGTYHFFYKCRCPNVFATDNYSGNGILKPSMEQMYENMKVLAGDPHKMTILNFLANNAKTKDCECKIRAYKYVKDE